MKKILVGLMAAAVLAGIAQAQEITSKNAVGFINIDVTEADVGKLYALTIPFNNMKAEAADPDKQHVGDWYFDTTDIANNSAKDSYVYFWNAEKQSWEMAKRKKSGFVTEQWLRPGDLFFFAPSAPMTITISGEVPEEGKTDGDLYANGALTGMGNPYPTDFDFDSSLLAQTTPKDSVVYFWDRAKQSWEMGKRKKSGFVTQKTVKAGDAFFFTTPSTEDSKWEFKKPYNWPGDPIDAE